MNARGIIVDQVALVAAAAGAPPLTDGQREALRRILTPVAPAAAVTPIRRVSKRDDITLGSVAA